MGKQHKIKWFGWLWHGYYESFILKSFNYATWWSPDLDLQNLSDMSSSEIAQLVQGLDDVTASQIFQQMHIHPPNDYNHPPGPPSLHTHPPGPPSEYLHPTSLCAHLPAPPSEYTTPPCPVGSYPPAPCFVSSPIYILFGFVCLMIIHTYPCPLKKAFFSV